MPENEVIEIYNYFLSLNHLKVKLGDTYNDLCHDAIIRCINNYDKYKNGSNIKAWAYTILRNIITDYYRFNKIRISISEFNLTSQEIRPNRHKEIRKLIHKKIKNRNTKSVMLLRLHGFKLYEIADFLDINNNTVKGIIAYNTKKLRYEQQISK